MNQVWLSTLIFERRLSLGKHPSDTCCLSTAVVAEQSFLLPDCSVEGFAAWKSKGIFPRCRGQVASPSAAAGSWVLFLNPPSKAVRCQRCAERKPTGSELLGVLRRPLGTCQWLCPRVLPDAFCPCYPASGLLTTLVAGAVLCAAAWGSQVTDGGFVPLESCRRDALHCLAARFERS